MIPISEAAVVGLLHWVAVSRPEIRTLGSMVEPAFIQLAAEYERSHARPFELRDAPMLEKRWLDAFQHLSRSERSNQYTRFSFEWERQTGTQLNQQPRWLSVDALERYRAVPFKAMFFLTSEDRLANAYIKEHWRALDSMSADYCDIYIGSVRGDTDDAAYKQMQSLSNIPGVAELRPNDLPCLLIWSGSRHVKLSLRVENCEPEDLTNRLRSCFSEIWKIGDSGERYISDGNPSFISPTDRILKQLEHLAQPLTRRSLGRDQMEYDVFISYKRRLRPQVSALAKALEDVKLRVWFDKAIEPGNQFHAHIAHHLRRSKAVIVAWSPDAFPKGGDAYGWVVGEAAVARDRLRTGNGGYVPILVEPTDLDPPFNTDHVIDLTTWHLKGDVARQESDEWRSLLSSLYPWTGDGRQIRQEDYVSSPLT